MFSYTQLRKDYPEFIYHGYQIKEEKERICLEYDFEIPGLSSFHPTWEFPKKMRRIESMLMTVRFVSWHFPWVW